MKKLLILFICINISLMPLISISSISYAEEQPTWTYVTQQDDEPRRSIVVGAIKAYLGGRGYNNTFTYTTEKAIVQWSYNNWDNFARSKGYNGLSDLNNHIAYRYNSNGVLQFFLDGTSLEMLNQMYSAILEYYNITENTNKQIYNSEYFTDLDGNGCYVYQAKVIGAVDSLSNLYTTEGTRYLYSGFLLQSSQELRNHIFRLTSSYPNVELTYSTSGSQFLGAYGSNRYILYQSNITTSDLIIFKQNNNYYFGIYQEMNNSPVPYRIYDFLQLTNAEAVNSAVSAAQAGMNAGIVANGKAAAISTGKDGANALKDYLEDNDSTDDDVITPVDDTTPPDDIPTGGTPPDYNDTGGVLTPDGNGGYNFNFKMPQLNIDWNLGLNVNNLPFPFSIPFDFNNALKMLDVEPETPRFQGTIHVPYINYDWEIDLDFGKYDEYETLINMFQKVLLFGYVISLILATRAVMHIY